MAKKNKEDYFRTQEKRRAKKAQQNAAPTLENVQRVVTDVTKKLKRLGGNGADFLEVVNGLAKEGHLKEAMALAREEKAKLIEQSQQKKMERPNLAQSFLNVRWLLKITGASKEEKKTIHAGARRLMAEGDNQATLRYLNDWERELGEHLDLNFMTANGGLLDRVCELMEEAGLPKETQDGLIDRLSGTDLYKDNESLYHHMLDLEGYLQTLAEQKEVLPVAEQRQKAQETVQEAVGEKRPSLFQRLRARFQRPARKTEPAGQRLVNWAKPATVWAAALMTAIAGYFVLVPMGGKIAAKTPEPAPIKQKIVEMDPQFPKAIPAVTEPAPRQEEVVLETIEVSPPKKVQEGFKKAAKRPVEIAKKKVQTPEYSATIPFDEMVPAGAGITKDMSRAEKIEAAGKLAAYGVSERLLELAIAARNAKDPQKRAKLVQTIAATAIETLKKADDDANDYLSRDSLSCRTGAAKAQKFNGPR